MITNFINKNQQQQKGFDCLISYFTQLISIKVLNQYWT